MLENAIYGAAVRLRYHTAKTLSRHCAPWRVARLSSEIAATVSQPPGMAFGGRRQPPMSITTPLCHAVDESAAEHPLTSRPKLTSSH